MQPKKIMSSMERNLRQLLERLGSKLDSLMGGKQTGPSINTILSELLLQIQRAIDHNLQADARGIKIVAPNRLRVLLDYQSYSRLNAQQRQLLTDELLISAQQYINDRRYQFTPPITLTLSYDPVSNNTLIEAETDAGATPTTPTTRTTPIAQAPSNHRPVAVPHAERITSRAAQTEAASRVGEAMVDQKAAEVAAISSYRLVGASGQVFNLKDLQAGAAAIGIGRARDNAVMLDDDSVSKFHARLAMHEDGRLWLADCGSTNGTALNDRSVSGRVEVKAGDMITFGDVALRLEKST